MQVFSGLITGGALGLFGGGMGYSMTQGDCGEEEEFCGWGGLLLGTSAGLTLGSALGVHRQGRNHGVNSPFWASYLGSWAGFAGGIALAVAMSHDDAIGAFSLLVGPIVGPTIGALIGHRLGLRPKEKPQTAARFSPAIRSWQPLPLPSRNLSGSP